MITTAEISRSIATIQGRPLGIRDGTFDVQAPEDVQDIRQDERLIAPFLKDVTKYSSYNFGLDRVISRIKNTLYLLPNDPEQPNQRVEAVESQDNIHAALQSWWDDSSKNGFSFIHLTNRQKSVWCLKLKVRFYTAKILLYQPSQLIRQPDASALKTCFDAACTILESYQSLHDIHCLNFGWRAIQNIFAAGATIIYTFWSSKDVQQHADVYSLSKHLRSCSSLLSIGGEWWASVKKGKESFDIVADLTTQKMYINKVTLKQPRLTRSQRPGPAVRAASVQEAQSARANDSVMSPSIPNMRSFDAQGDEAVFSQDWNPSWMAPSVDEPDFPTMFDRSGPSGFTLSPQASLDMVPEIEHFLADFDHANFNWNAAVADLDGQHQHSFDFGVRDGAFPSSSDWTGYSGC